MIRYTDLPDNKDKPFGGAYSVYDKNTVNMRDYFIQKYTKDAINFEKAKLDYFDVFKYFLSESHELNGINLYTHSCFTQGTTESFSHFYLRFYNKRLRIPRGEYFYHQMTKALYFSNRFSWLEDEELKQGDALVISAPFSDTCDLYPNFDQILTECDEKEIPVLVDLAYLNLAIGLKINLSHPCIEYVVSSLSKVFPLENHRIGIRLQKTMFEDPLYVINEPNYNYINMLSVYLGKEMMQAFEPDYIFKKYVDKQKEFCNKLNLIPTRCVYFGLDKHNAFPEYCRGRETNRLCFSRIWDGRMSL